MLINNLNNFPASQKILTPCETFYLFDIGARRGFHPVFNNYKQIIKIGFEPEKNEFTHLSLNKNFNEYYYPVALGGHEDSTNFYNCKNPGSSGFLEPNMEYWSRFAEADNLEVTSINKIETITLDYFTRNHTIKDCDFIKIDTEGFDLKILEGGVETITNNSLGVVTEVYFNPIRKNLPLFGQTHQLMEKYGFSLYFLDSYKHCKREFAKQNNIKASEVGQIVLGQALFLRDPFIEKNINSKFSWTLGKYKKLIFLYEIFNLNDCAYELVNFLNKKKLLNEKEYYMLKRLFLKKSFKNKFLNVVYNNLKFHIMPKSIRKFFRKYI